jgi:hypothetical protein
MWPCAIHEDLVTTLEAKALVDSLVTCYLRGASCFRFRANPPPVETEKGVRDAHEAISLALSENPVAFVQQLSRLTSLPPTPLYRRLTQSLDSKARDL